MTATGYRNYRCPHCLSDRCGNDAVSGWDVVLQESSLLSEYDNQWCNDCGDVTLEEFEITDAAEIARIDAARALLAARDAAPQLLAAAEAALALLSDLSAARARDRVSATIGELSAAIAAAWPERKGGVRGRAPLLG